MINNHQIERKHIEALILSCFLNSHISTPLDEMEINEANIPFELFKASRATKLISKAIYNLKQKGLPYDDVNVLCYIKEQTEINEHEYFQISCSGVVSYDTMMKYIKRLEIIDKEEEMERAIRNLR